MALIVGIFHFIYQYVRRDKQLVQKAKALKVSKLKELESRTQLEVLQAKINPHFLYNSLNSLAVLAKEDPDKTEEMALALSRFLRYGVNRNEEPKTTLSEELKMVKDYLAIEKIRYGEKLRFNIEIPSETKNELIPHFLLQPLVENAIKHGRKNPENDFLINLAFEKSEGQLRIRIEDNGVPFPDDIQAGYGLKSVFEKLDLLYPGNYEISFQNEPKKRVEILLNV